MRERPTPPFGVMVPHFASDSRPILTLSTNNMPSSPVKYGLVFNGSGHSGFRLALLLVAVPFPGSVFPDHVRHLQGMRPHVGLYFAEKLGLIAVYAALIDPDPEFIDRPGQQPVSSGQ